MVRIALALPLENEDRLAAEAQRYGHDIVARYSTAHELAILIGDRPTSDDRSGSRFPDVAIVAATERHLTDRLLALADEAGVRVIALVDGEVERRHAASLGLLETADSASAWPELEQLLAVIPSRPLPTVVAAQLAEAAAAPRGTIIAIWGPAGAPGRTTIAINVAAELAALGKTVVLADVDTYSGSIAPSLGLLDEAPGFAAACRLAGAESLTTAELERIGQRYQSGHASFWVLTGIGRPSRWPELSASRVAETLDRCRDWVEYTVVDVGFSLEHDEEISSDLSVPRRNAAGLTVLSEADRVIAVGAADPVGLSRFLRAHVDLVETVAAGRVLVVINKIRASAIGLNPIGQVTQTLSRFGGIDSSAMIPFDSAVLDAAILSGKTLADVAPRSVLRVAVRDLVTSRILPKAASGRRRRRALRAVSP